ncbi:MAG TPA: sigma-54 dependent transcriptional regulator [Terriglobia bacterium]|nr:sigma-54 dependent transcriptional regulator [Terriglobia bacterium]
MLHRVVIINDLPNTSEHRLDRLLPADAGFRHRYLSCDSSAPREIGAFGAHLVIAFAAAERARALALFQSLRDWLLALPVLAVLAGEPDDDLLKAAAETADDFIFRPLRPSEFQRRVAKLLATNRPDVDAAQNRLSQELGLAQLVGQHPAFVEVITQIPRLAASDAPVLLLGETGTGKELCARAIHHLSPRTNFPFIPVDCGALPEHLAENELFGHTRGAFTDAHAEQKGLAGMAEGGTLFLDEIDSLSIAVQAKLLRFLEDRTYRALGADRFTRSNVRVLAASNRDLEACVRDKQFRSDLYFRLNVLHLRLPALRHRGADIALLACHFLESLRRPECAQPRSFSPSALRMLERYQWPGNVRELHNVVHRAILFGAGPQILPGHIALDVPPEPHAAATFREGRARAVAEYERRYVEEMLRKHEGNITRAAREARKDRRAFGRLVKKYAVGGSSV